MNIIVIGDIMIDETVYGAVDRISPEAPIPVLQESYRTKIIGGAGNVARNLKAIYPEGNIFLMGLASLECTKLVQNINWVLQDLIPNNEMNIKLRYVDTKTGYQLLRIDNEESINCKNKTLDTNQTIDNIRKINPNGIVFSDYNKGTLTEELIIRLIQIANKKNIWTFADMRRNNIECYKEIMFITPNNKEFNIIAQERTPTQVIQDLDLCGILLTRGHEGMDLYYKNMPALHRDATENHIVDVTGAGDTALAAFTIATMLKNDHLEALTVANKMAGEVCMLKGTAIPKTTIYDHGY